MSVSWITADEVDVCREVSGDAADVASANVEFCIRSDTCTPLLILTLHQAITVPKHTHTHYCISLLHTEHIQSLKRSRDSAERIFCCLLAFLCCLCEEQDLVIQWLEGVWPQDTCSMTVETGGILDTRNTIGVPILDGADEKWKSWRVKFEAYAELADMGTHLDVAAEQISSIKHDGLKANSVTISRTVHALLITKREGKAPSLVSLVLRRFGLEAWRVLKEEYGSKGGNHTAACTAKNTTLVTSLLPVRKTLHSAELLQVQTCSRRLRWRLTMTLGGTRLLARQRRWTSGK